MQSIFIKKEMAYKGKELSPHWIYRNFNIIGDAIVSFLGECEVKLDDMVDISDVISNSPIYSRKMLHFIVESFNIELIEGILRQRLLVNIARDEICACLPNSVNISRHGDDLFYNDSKLSVSIATKSPTSVLIHLGINIDAEGAPVKACGLTSELKIENIEKIADNIMKKYVAECEEIIRASCKVRGVL